MVRLPCPETLASAMALILGGMALMEEPREGPPWVILLRSWRCSCASAVGLGVIDQQLPHLSNAFAGLDANQGPIGVNIGSPGRPD